MKSTILLFEDNPLFVDKMKAAIQGHLTKNFVLEVFPLDKAPGKGAFEDLLATKVRAYSNVVLLVTDRDLSASQWGGLSEAAVSRAGAELGIPVACYRQEKASAPVKIRRSPGDGRIQLPSDFQARGEVVAALAKGFVELERLVKEHKPDKNPERNTPGHLLSSILGVSEIASHFDSYASGDQITISTILALPASASGKANETEKRKLIVALGVWLADVVMQYPGILVDKTAAESYLDISPKSFERADVQEVFDSARLRDVPFALDAYPKWWRHKLDDLVRVGDSVTGLELCKKKGLKRLTFCPCSVDPKLHAGYYCMATSAPISEEHSSGRVSWFPPGADLARLSKSFLRKLGPWIGS